LKSHKICKLADIVPDTGVCALVGDEQVAVFRVQSGRAHNGAPVGDSVHAVGNFDPFSRANVISRGIVGDLNGELVVASPVYKQHFSLASGRCLEDAAVRLPVYAARVEDGFVWIEPRREVATTCCYCGVGCGVIATVANNEIASVRGDPKHPANFGRLCTKGLSLHKADPSFRGLFPEINNERRSWDETLEYLAGRFAETIARHGPDSVAFYVSGQFLTEDYYAFNKLAKGLIGTNNIDTNSRLCMASAVAGYKQTLGADAPPACYEDVDHAECVFIAGSNTAWAHPVLYSRIESAGPRHLIVVDPRRTETARAATLHLQIAPGTDVALFNGMLHVILREGWHDESYIGRHTEGFDGLLSTVKEFTPEKAAGLCGIEPKQLLEAANLFARSRSTLSLYCQGLNQSSSGTAKNAALINLHLATAQIGRPGAGPFSLTGQPNAMGGREVGGMANLLSAHRDLASEKDRDEIARFWGVSEVPAKPGKTAVEMFEALRAGEIKIVWIACTNPAQSLPDQTLVHEALERAELVIVQDAYRDTETAAFADVFLPAASWGEKEGTMTNSERRISRVRAAVRPPGEAREDWRIAVEFSKKLFLPGKKKDLLSYEKAEDLFNEHRETTRGRDLDITGLSYALLDTLGPQQWPFPEDAKEGKKRLYEDGVFPTASGRARFVPTPYRPVAEDADESYPLRLTTGRLRDQWHTMSRTGTIASLFAHEPEPRLTMHPQDLSRLGLTESDLVKVSSRRGHLYLKPAADPDLRPGMAFAPMHWGARFLGGEGRRGINELTLGALDPVSRQPELKHCAVKVERANLPWRFVGTRGAADVASLMKRLEPFMQAVPYAVRTLVGRERPGVRLRLAAEVAPPKGILKAIEAAFQQEGGEIVPDEDSGRGRTICNCFDVAEDEIDAFLARSNSSRSNSLQELQASLKCGTNCGSCLPEVRRRIAA
jgi:assimilatory nitrate reductase catalytic subunit